MKSGEILVDGQSVRIKSSIELLLLIGIAHVPESRKEQGLFLSMSVKENIIMAELKKHAKAGIVSWKQANESANQYIEDLNIKIASPEQQVSNLSGGNQQR